MFVYFFLVRKARWARQKFNTKKFEENHATKVTKIQKNEVAKMK